MQHVQIIVNEHHIVNDVLAGTVNHVHRVPWTLLPSYDEQERMFSWLAIGTASKLQVEGLKRSDCWQPFPEKTEL